MSAEVLFVDDDLNILQGYQRTLRRQFKIETVDSGAAALSMLEGGRNFAVIVSDMRMPGMDGLELLRSVKSRSQDTVRIMVTGNTDQQTAVAAINEGDVYRFLTKPCDPDVLVKTLQDGIEQYRLIQAERELLEGTLAGAVGALSETLALVNPEAFGRIDRMKALLNGIAAAVGFGPPWKAEVMATLSQLGCVILPDGTLRKLSRGQKLSEEENQLYEMHPSMGCNMIEKIPRLGDVAEAIRYQLKSYDGTGVPNDKLAGAAIPLGARLLKLINDFISAESTGLAPADAIHKLREHAECYDPDMLRALGDHLGVAKVARTIKLSVAMLAPGMVLAKDLMTRDGSLLLGAGQKLTETSRERLLGHLANGVIDDGIEVEPAAAD
ncbi:MAG: response regulator [Gammaproteobacteria bacterium]|nr:response regulator [Gammaproteobacteria bacterium]